jgi:hypothetical protein
MRHFETETLAPRRRNEAKPRPLFFENDLKVCMALGEVYVEA